MPGGKFFVDSNVVLYTLGNDLPKKFVAATLLAARPTLSTQVLAETTHVARRKLGFSIAVVGRMSAALSDMEVSEGAALFRPTKTTFLVPACPA